MKEGLSSLDIYYLLKELRNRLKGARLQKFYQVNDTLIIQLHIPNHGTNELLFSLNHIALTKYKIERPSVPSNFAMALRKYLKGKRIENIKQVEFDRIVVLETKDYELVLEMFSNGNIIFKDKKEHIWSLMKKQVWSERILKIHQDYKYPPLHKNPYSSEKEFMDYIWEIRKKDRDRKLINLLLNDFSFGPVYSSEILKNAKINEDVLLKDVEKGDIIKIYDVVKNMKNRVLNPKIILDKEGRYVDVVPFNLKVYKNYDFKEYVSFNEAVDDYFIGIYENINSGKALTSKEKYSLKERLEFRLKSQLKKKEEIEKKIKEKEELGNLVLENYSKIDYLIKEIRGRGLDVVKDLDYIDMIDYKEKYIVLKINGKKVKIHYNENVGKNSERYFNEVKKLKEKLKGLENAILETETLIKETPEKEEGKKKVVALKVKDKKKWYEKFNYIFTSNGFLCVIGKDATSNEVLIKKYMGNNDIVVHSDITGSPFGLIKEIGKNKDFKDKYKEDIMECSQFIGCRSRAWKTGAGNVEVYWVNPEQVTKKTKAGEYMGKGSFMIYGERNYNKVDLKYAVGFDKENGLIHGPEILIKKKTNVYVVLSPGHDKAKELSKRIRAKLYEKANNEDKERIKHINLGDIAELIPFGVGEIVK